MEFIWGYYFGVLDSWISVMVSTLPCHGGSRGSNPLSMASFFVGDVAHVALVFRMRIFVGRHHDLLGG